MEADRPCADRGPSSNVGLGTVAIVIDLRAAGDRVWRRFSAPKDDILWHYGAPDVAFGANPAHHAALVDELDQVVLDMFGSPGRLNPGQLLRLTSMRRPCSDQHAARYLA